MWPPILKRSLKSGFSIGISVNRIDKFKYLEHHKSQIKTDVWPGHLRLHISLHRSTMTAVYMEVLRDQALCIKVFTGFLKALTENNTHLADEQTEARGCHGFE